MNQASLRTIIPIVLSWVHSSFGSTVVRPYSIEMTTHSFNSLKQDESTFTFSCCQRRPSPTLCGQSFYVLNHLLAFLFKQCQHGPGVLGFQIATLSFDSLQIMRGQCAAVSHAVPSNLPHSYFLHHIHHSQQPQQPMSILASWKRLCHRDLIAL